MSSSGPTKRRPSRHLEDLRDIMDDRYALLAHHRRRKMTPTTSRVCTCSSSTNWPSTFGVAKRSYATSSPSCSATSCPEVAPPASSWSRRLRSRVTRSCRPGFETSSRFDWRCAAPVRIRRTRFSARAGRARDISAATIDPSMRGVGYLLAEGGVPTLVMTPYLNDEEIEVIAARAYELRSGR